MTTLEEIEHLLTKLHPAEKVQLLQKVARELSNVFPGIVHNPSISGGDAMIVRTRIPVWLLVQARRLGTSEAELLQSYPTLHAEDLTNAWAYARRYPDEIEQAIVENEEDNILLKAES